jgi:hypothetical protein
VFHRSDAKLTESAMKQSNTSVLGAFASIVMTVIIFPLLALLTAFSNLYKQVMTFPVRDLYVRLPGMIMRPLCRLFLTLFPAKYEGVSIKEKKKVLFIVNHGILCKQLSKAMTRHSQTKSLGCCSSLGKYLPSHWSFPSRIS